MEASMKTIDEQLEDALARVRQLETDAQAGTNLLNEAAKTSQEQRERITALTSENTALTKDKETLALANSELTEQRDKLTNDLATAKQSLTSTASAVQELAKTKDQIATLTADMEKLRADAKTAERIAAERYGAASSQPLPITPRGDAKATELVAKFKAITDPKEQTTFWRSLTPEQRTLILNAQ
jgi:chromosome segregation ATPase